MKKTQVPRTILLPSDSGGVTAVTLPYDQIRDLASRHSAKWEKVVAQVGPLHAMCCDVPVYKGESALRFKPLEDSWMQEIDGDFLVHFDCMRIAVQARDIEIDTENKKYDEIRSQLVK